MAIALRGANSSGNSTCAIANAGTGFTANAGDLICVWGFNPSNNTIPTIPSGYTSPTNGSFAGGVVAGMFCYKVAAGGETTVSGVTNSGNTEVRVYSGGVGVGDCQQGHAGDGTCVIPALTLHNTDNTSWVAAGQQANAATNMTTAPSGMGNEDDNNHSSPPALMACDTNGTVSSFTSKSISINGIGWISIAVEILVAPSAQNITMTLAALGLKGFVLTVNAKSQITMQMATLRFAGFSLAANAKQMLAFVLGTLKYAGFALGAVNVGTTAIVQAVLKWAGAPLAVNAKSMFAFSTGALKWAGAALGANGRQMTAITLATLKWAGGALGVNAKTMTAIAQAPLVFAGKVITVTGAVTVAIVQGVLRFSGQALQTGAVIYARLLALLGIGR